MDSSEAPPRRSGPRTGEGVPPALAGVVESLRRCLRARHYSTHTEKAYVAWLLRFALFHGGRHPESLSAGDVRAFLIHLAVERRVSSSTQNQALNALLFLYREVLRRRPTGLDTLPRARRSVRVPVVPSHDEIRRLLAHVRGPLRLMIALLYGAGLRISECCRLRVRDLDFAGGQITVRGGKGQKDRQTILPSRMSELRASTSTGCARRTAPTSPRAAAALRSPTRTARR